MQCVVRGDQLWLHGLRIVHVICAREGHALSATANTCGTRARRPPELSLQSKQRTRVVVISGKKLTEHARVEQPGVLAPTVMTQLKRCLSDPAMPSDAKVLIRWPSMAAGLAVGDVDEVSRAREAGLGSA